MGVSVCALCAELWGGIQLRPVSPFATVSLNHKHSLAGPQRQAVRGCVLGVAATKVGSQMFTQTPFSDTAWGAAGVEPEPSPPPAPAGPRGCGRDCGWPRAVFTRLLPLGVAVRVS